MKDLFVVKTRGGLLNAYSISRGKRCSLLVLNNSLYKDHEYYIKYFITDVNLINLKSLFLFRFFNYRNYYFEWGCGISDNYILVIIHLIHSLLKKDWFKYFHCIAYILNRPIIVFPHGCNLYGEEAYKHINPSFFNNRNFVYRYIVDNKKYMSIVSKLFLIQKNKIIAEKYCFNLKVRKVSNKLIKTNNIIVLMPKASRVSKKKFYKFLKFTNCYNFTFNYFIHPNDYNSDLYNIDYFKSSKIIVSTSSSNDFELMSLASAIIDCGTSLFLISIHFNSNIYRFNITKFNTLLFDNDFRILNRNFLKLPFFNKTFHDLNECI